MKNYFFKWVFGFFVLLSLDLFMEGLVFEWLGWNRTIKNDWFFCIMVGIGSSMVYFWISNFYKKIKKI